MKRLALFIAACALCCAPAFSQTVPALPAAGITVSASATVTTTDILIDLGVTDKVLATPNSAQVYLQAAKSIAGITSAAGAAATVTDDGVHSTTLGISESATVAVAPADLKAVAARLAGAHYTVETMTVVPRDPQALENQALTLATKAARAKAAVIASADGRTVGRMVSASPSYASIFKDMYAGMPQLGALSAMFGQRNSLGVKQTASVTADGSFTFELAP